MKACYACKKGLSVGREIGRKDECPHCHADLHCCRNCRFYDPSASRQCREPLAELVREKEKANFCDYFAFADRPAQGAEATGPEGTRKALDDLFRK